MTGNRIELFSVKKTVSFIYNLNKIKTDNDGFENFHKSKLSEHLWEAVSVTHVSWEKNNLGLLKNLKPAILQNHLGFNKNTAVGSVKHIWPFI